MSSPPGVNSLEEGQKIKIEDEASLWKKFNLDWAPDHASLVWYFMIVFALLGFFTTVSRSRRGLRPSSRR